MDGAGKRGPGKVGSDEGRRRWAVQVRAVHRWCPGVHRSECGEKANFSGRKQATMGQNETGECPNEPKC